MMRAIIVDDEKHVRDAVMLLVPWEELGIAEVLEAQDGLDAIRLVTEHKPQIVITDMMMPLGSGKELLEWLSEHYPQGKTIVISGHDDFDLVRHAVKYGGVDYILKPVDGKQLRAAMERAIRSWEAEEAERRKERERSMEMNRIRPVFWDKILSCLISEPASYEQHAAALDKEFGLGRQIRECRVAIVSLDTMSPRLRAKFEPDLDLLFFSLTNVCNEVLRDGTARSGVAYRYWNSESEIILLLYGRQGEAAPLLEKLERALVATFRSSLDIGASRVRAFPAELPAAYQEARQALNLRNLLQSEKKVHLYEPGASAPLGDLAFGDYAESIRLAVRSGSPEQIRRAVAGWMQRVSLLERITAEQLELWWHEFHVAKNKWQAEWFGSEAPAQAAAEASFGSMPLSALLGEDGSLSLQLWEKRLIDSLTGLSRAMLGHQRQENSVIHDIAKYIQQHYREEMTLQSISGQFFLSREYISRKFKQVFGLNLSDYLSGIRMEHAKVLLLNPHLRIAQVAQMVGYDDEKYFSKVFKKLVGQTPNEYRKVNST
ncbi:response regulator [Paenibacillus ginsengihumi]|uniref:response regulator n=1 Tax=Paenibacillus ginsengihumi TaxID=431596 RepID=UPI000370F7EB|nr:response regulator [Paenibacillus ginsengihumi]